MSALKKFARRLRRNTSGNTALIVGLGMPALIGGAGFAVDTAQWYLWQRELQYAADQAAMAGAWARGNGDTGTVYQTRAGQEFAVNLQVTEGNTPTHTASLADYLSGTQNSVVVTASVTGNLPFSNFVMGRAATVSVRSQAIWESEAAYNPCILAVKPSGSRGVWFNGGPNVNAPCGIGAVSDGNGAVAISGNSGTYDVGFVITAGSVTDTHDGFANATVVENSEGVFDPFEELTPPDNPAPRTLSCGASSDPWTADETQVEAVTYNYYQGRNARQAENGGTITYTGTNGSLPTTSAPLTFDDQTFSTSPTTRSQVVTGSLVAIEGRGPDTIWEQPVTTTTFTYSDISFSAPGGTQLPGTYSDFQLSCDTTLAGGIYVIDGGRLQVNASYSLTGNGVMFVLKNGADIQINGGASIDLSAMTALELIAAGVSAADAAELENMLVFEHRDSQSNNRNLINGNASTRLDGVIYTPNSPVDLLGTMAGTSGTGRCLMIAANEIQIGGTADLTTFCDPSTPNPVYSVNGGTRVRLVG
nr:pilus assembly protein TadG-related protein [Altererythrobacter lutimaris]